ncbi:MAG: radical SAM protein [Planctomycetaceae bacterium]
MTLQLPLRDYTFIGTTTSLCPECLEVVPAKILNRGGRIYFRKHCPTHGSREDFVCSDASHYDRMEFTVPGKVPRMVGVPVDRGCPYDCGLCTEHEQHTCIGLVELTDACNLECPMCYAASGPGQKHRTVEECKAAIDRLVKVEGRPEILQLSGGEPTIHPQFIEIFEYAHEQPIDYVMINTNGLRFAKDDALLEAVAKRKNRVEIYFQFDGFKPETSRALRGEELLDQKLRAIDRLGEAGLNVILVTTLQSGVNEDEMGAIIRFGMERPWITGVSFQPATYSGRHVLPEELEQRITFPDVIKGIVEQSEGVFETRDFVPLPCAHPNCHQLTYVYRKNGQAVPLTRFVNAVENLDLLANGITFTRPRVKEVIDRYLNSCGDDCGCGTPGTVSLQMPTESSPKPSSTRELSPQEMAVAVEFFANAMNETLSPQDVFRITITNFLDAYTFDTRRLMKCCTHHILPSGHVIPFCAYNVLYRNGHLPLPELVNK